MLSNKGWQDLHVGAETGVIQLLYKVSCVILFFLRISVSSETTLISL